MKKLMLLIVLLTGSISYSQEHETLLHYGAGVVAGGAGAFLAHEISGGDKWWTIAGAIGTSLIAGITKEAIDKWEDGNWDNTELAATAAGGITVGVAIELFSGRKKSKAASRMQEYEQLFVHEPDPFQEPDPNPNSRYTSHD